LDHNYSETERHPMMNYGQNQNPENQDEEDEEDEEDRPLSWTGLNTWDSDPVGDEEDEEEEDEEDEDDEGEEIGEALAGDNLND
jgi:hypothetical protein